MAVHENPYRDGDILELLGCFPDVDALEVPLNMIRQLALRSEKSSGLMCRLLRACRKKGGENMIRRLLKVPLRNGNCLYTDPAAVLLLVVAGSPVCVLLPDALHEPDGIEGSCGSCGPRQYGDVPRTYPHGICGPAGRGQVCLCRHARSRSGHGPRRNFRASWLFPRTWRRTSATSNPYR